MILIVVSPQLSAASLRMHRPAAPGGNLACLNCPFGDLAGSRWGANGCVSGEQRAMNVCPERSGWQRGGNQSLSLAIPGGGRYAGNFLPPVMHSIPCWID